MYVLVRGTRYGDTRALDDHDAEVLRGIVQQFTFNPERGGRMGG